MDTLTFGWDLTGNGLYNDYTTQGQTGFSQGQYSYNTLGLHTIGVRVTDDDGAVAFGSTTLLVSDPAPEPATLSLLASGSLVAAGWCAWVRRRRPQR